MHIRRFSVIAMIILLTAVLVGVVLVTLSSARATNINPPPRNHPHIIFNDGMPAIARKGNTSLLTTADVAHYVTAYPFPGGPMASGGVPTIIILQLMTSREASNLLGGEDIGLPDNAQVYFVVLRGPFVMENMHVPPGEQVPAVDRGDEVFDAQTGNLLLWGIDG